jgi:hypothetical protein
LGQEATGQPLTVGHLMIFIAGWVWISVQIE